MKGLVSRNVVLGIIGVFTMACAPSLDNVIATVEEAVEAAASAQPKIEAIYTADLEEVSGVDCNGRSEQVRSKGRS